MTKDEMQERIEQLKAQREKYVQDANRVIGEFNGRISQLEELVAEMDAVKELAAREPNENGLMAKEPAQ